MQRVSTYRGEKVEITYDRRRCIHAAECGRGSKALFDARQDPWCRPDAVSPEEAVAVVARCPSGALRIHRLDGGSEDPPASASGITEILVSPNGPLWVHGAVTIAGSGEELGPRVALCRCGASRNKPLCDGSHEGAGFEDAGPVASDPAAETPPPGTLTLNPATNGPLVFDGPLMLRSASGRLAFRGTKAALCRCGASANKPFCDGSHKKVGFTSD